MTKKILLAIFLLSLLSCPAWATNWCNDAATEVCINYEDDISDDSVNNFTVTTSGVVRTTTSPPAAYSTTYGVYDSSRLDYLSINDTGGIIDFESATEDFSGCLWVYFENGFANNWIYTMEDGNDDFWRLINLGSSNKGFFSLDAVDTTATDAYGDSTWVHACFTADRDGNLTHYKNGAPNGTGALSSEELSLASTVLYIGRASASAGFEGLMDDHIITSDILSSTDINDIMINGLVQAAPPAGRTRRMFISKLQGVGLDDT